MEKAKRKYLRRSVVRVGLGLGMLLGAVSSVQAFSIDAANTDLKMRWDNTVRYNLGFRAKDCDQNICGNGAGAGDIYNYQSDRKFAKAGDVVTNRLDLLSEFDLIYKGSTGFRVSAAGWFDEAYKNPTYEGDPYLDTHGGAGAGPAGSPFNNRARRWNRGLSGEILDAFGFTQLNLGDVPVDIKLGQHNIYWGESLFSAFVGVSYNQGPMDFRKGLANPGTEAKELFRPLDQISFAAQVADRVSIAGQYYLDWKPTALPDGGTYFGLSDGFTLYGPGYLHVSREPNKKRGDWGLALKWRPEWTDAGLGFYYREFTSKSAQFVRTGTFAYDGVDFSADDEKRQKLYGFSFSKSFGGVSVSGDLTYRPDSVLAAAAFVPVVGPNTSPSSWVPRGDIQTALVNAVAYLGKNSVFDSAVLMGELTYARLDKVTAHGENYNGEGYGNCPGNQPLDHGCPTKDGVGLSLMFIPKWFQVFDGIDLSVPVYFSQGLKGNSPVLFDVSEGMGSYSVGIEADVSTGVQKYNFSLKYNGQISKHSNDAAGAASNINTGLGKFWDRDWISLTVKTTF